MAIPILMYHEVEDANVITKRYTVTTQNFERQLQRVRERGYQTVSLDELRRLEQARATGDRRCIAITFDDSHLAHYATSTPLLVKYGIKATFFVVTGFLGNDPQWMNKAQLLEMHRTGMDIQSHTHTHRFLDTLSRAQLREELADSKALLEDWLGKPIHHLSCPGGRYNAQLLDVAREVGYRTVSSSVPGVGARNHALPLLPRFIITGETSAAEYDRIIAAERTYVLRRRAAYSVKHAAKRMLGNNLYYSLWKRLARSS